MPHPGSRLSVRRQYRRNRRQRDGRDPGSLIAHASRVRQRSKLSMRRFRRIEMPETDVPSPRESLPAQPLSQLTGITPALERRLHALGHTRFFQLAHWTSQDIEIISEALDLATIRIHTQHWVAQARKRG